MISLLKNAIKALGFRWDRKTKQWYKQLSNAAFEQRAITKLLYAVIKNAPYKSCFKSLVCHEELGGITEIDNEMLNKIYNFYLFDMTCNLFNTDGFVNYKERVCAS